MTSHTTSMERVVAALSHREPDRVPLFLLFGCAAAREIGLSVREYTSRPDLVAEAQIMLRRKYGTDCLYGFIYAAVETEAMGGDLLYLDEAPPLAGAPIFSSGKDIRAFEPPKPEEAPSLRRVLDAIAEMQRRSGNEAPIIGVVISPFSLPIMQMGFERYLDLLGNVLHGVETARELLDELLRKNLHFCEAWARAQIAAGAHALVYFDPVSSPTMVPGELFDVGKRTARLALEALRATGAPMACHFASGRSGALVDDLVDIGFSAMSASMDEDLAELKKKAAGRIALVGNLDGISMRHWTPVEAERRVRAAVEAAGPGGGFLLSDQHGEIPWQVPETVISAISDAARRWGTYPIRREEADGE